LILGDVETVDVVIRAPETPEVAGRPLRLSVNVGAFGPVERVEPGVYRSTYRLPETAFPQVALVAVWRETGPDADIRFFRIPLHGRTTVPVRARSGARVTVRVGDATFGPTTARRGRARVPIVVPPGVEEVTVTSERGDQRSQARVAAGVPPYNRLTLALTPYKIPSDGDSHAVLHAYVDRVPPVDPDRVVVTAPRGRFERLGADGPVYRFRYVPERAETRSSVEISGRVLRDPASRASVELELGLPVPERIVVQPEAERWVADGTEPLDVVILVTDRLGLGVEGLDLTATATPATVESLTPRGNGRYRLRLAPLDDYPPGGGVAVDLEVRRDEGPPLVESVVLPVQAPPWPTEIELAPRAPLARPDLAYVYWRARDAAGAPFDGDGFVVEVQARDLEAGPIEALGGGRYRSGVDPGPNRRALEVRVLHVLGSAEAARRVRIERDVRRVELGARLGPLYSEGVHLLGGIELGVRLPMLQNRIAARVRVSYFQREQSFGAPFAEGTETIDGHLRMLPIGLGATVDAFRFSRGAVYGGAFGLLAPGFEALDPRFDAPVERNVRLFGGVEGVLGVAWRGLFLELAGGWLPVSESDLEAPDLLLSATLGYRLGLF
jgi:hypothetical protein